MFSSQGFSLRIIFTYLGKEYLRAFFLCLFLLWSLALLIDFFDRLDDFIRQGPSFFSVARYFFFKAPLFVTQMAPAAALTGSLLSLSLLSRNREILAFKACGISPVQIAFPLVLSALFLSITIWLWNEFIVPYAFHKARYINTVEIKKKPFKSFYEHGFWYHGKNLFYHVEHFDARKNVLSEVQIYTLDDQFTVHSLVEVSRAFWQENRWHCEGWQETVLTANDGSSALSCVTLFEETPEDFALVAMEAEEFSSQQLRVYIADLQHKGLDTTAYLVDLHLKSALPIATLVMTLLGLSLAIPGARQLTITKSVGLALIIGFGYWVLLAVAISLGHSGALPPLLSAWVANSATGLVGIFFLLGVD